MAEELESDPFGKCAIMIYKSDGVGNFIRGCFSVSSGKSVIL